MTNKELELLGINVEPKRWYDAVLKSSKHGKSSSDIKTVLNDLSERVKNFERTGDISYLKDKEGRMIVNEDPDEFIAIHLNMFKDDAEKADKKLTRRNKFINAYAKFITKSWKWDMRVAKWIANKLIPTKIDDWILKQGEKVNDFAIEGVDSLAQALVNKNKRKIEAKYKEYEDLKKKVEASRKEKDMGKGKDDKSKDTLNHNHDIWYLRFKGDNLAPLNYYDSVDEWTEFQLDDSVKQLTPLVMRIPIQLVLPTEGKYLARLNQAFTANLTSLLNARGYGYTEYSSKDVGNFIMNVRFATAVLALAIRTAKVYSNYNTLNIMEPDVLIAAHNTSYYTKSVIQAERNNIVNLKERIRLSIQALKTLTAGATPLYDRTLYLLSNFFKDSKTKKSTLFVFDLDMDDEDGYFTVAYHEGNSTTLQQQVYTGNDLYGISDMLDTFDDIMNKCFVNDYKAKQIRSDINYLYGVTGSTQYTTYFESAYKSINEPLKFIDDENIKLQIHNMIFRNRMQPKFAQSGNHATFQYFDGTNLTQYFTIDLDLGAAIGTSGTRTKSLNYTKINAWKKITADNLVAVTRFYEFIPINHTIRVTDDPNNQGVLSLKITMPAYESGKFELPTMMQVITYNATFNGLNQQFSTKNIIGSGNILVPRVTDQSAIAYNYPRDLALWCWSYADWMPHVKTNVDIYTSVDKGDTPSLEINDNFRVMHDLDMFANISNNQLSPMDSVALLSEIIWTQNGSSIIDTSRSKQAKDNNAGKGKDKGKK